MKPRVLHLVSTLGIGGQEMVILSLVKHLDRERFDTMVMAMHEGGPIADRIEALGVAVEVVAGPWLSGVPLVRKLVDRIRAYQPDVLHTHNPGPHQHGAAARLFTRTPVLIHTKHGRNTFPTRIGQWGEQFAGRFTDRVVPVSTDAAVVARNLDRVPQHKLQVIHNGIALNGSHCANVLPLGRPPRAVHVARLNRVKDQPTLLAAARLVADQLPGFTIDIVGDGPARDIVHAEAERLDLSEVVRFHGMRDDVNRFLAEADLFILPSLSEGIAITLLEAMAAGLPVVATDVGGNREVVISGETGALVPVGDPEAVAAAIIYVLTNPEMARRWGAAGRERVATDFNIERTVMAYQDAYIELLGNRRARRRGTR